MAASSADRNLLYGMLALQMNFVRRDALLAAMQAWVFDKAKPLGQILADQGQLTTERRQVLDRMLDEHLRAYDDDAHKSLAGVAVPAAVRNDLCALADADVQASLSASGLSLSGLSLSADPDATRAFTHAAEGGRYQILRPHARGGLGEVFIALDQELHREVALKEIQPRFVDDADSRSRFVQEAEITGGLEHPGIVPVYGLGCHADGRPYYAMRFIQGETLKDAIRKLHAGDPGVSLRGLLTRFVAVCNAVAYAHSRGVLHRDLKPANVMLGKYGETLLVDWGLAKAVGHEVAGSAGDALSEATLRPRSGDSSTQTRVGSAVGTPAYMSPEQAGGQLDRMSQASDVYGLGATLYAILTGQAPVEGKDSVEVLEVVRVGAWKPPRSIKEDVAPALDAICCKAMAQKPQDRYASALALAADVEAWLADEPVAAHGEPWTARTLRWMRRRQKLVTAAAAALGMAALALGVGVVLLSAANERERELRGAAQENAELARDQRDEAQRRRDQAWYQLYVANINLARREWESGNLAHARDLLDQCRPTRATDKDLRGWEWHYLDRLCHLDLREFRGHTDAVRAVAFSPDGARLATTGNDSTVRVWDVAGGGQLQVLKESGKYGLAFSPDGHRVATAGREGIVRVWDLDKGAPQFDIKAHKPGSVRHVTFNLDGTRLATAGEDTVVRVWDSATGKLLQELKGHTSDVYVVAFSPDGKQLASADRDGTVRVWDVAQRRELHVHRGHTGSVQSVAYSPDGTRLAWAGQDGAVRIWDLAERGEPRALRGHSGIVNGVAYSPDGLWLASAGADGTLRIWNTVSGQETRVLRGHTGRVFSVAFSPDGTRLASAGVDGTARLWDPAVSEPRTLLGHKGTVSLVMYSPDGAQLISTGQDGTVRICETTGNQVVGIHKVHQSWVNGLALSADRTRLAAACGDGGALRFWDLAKGGPPRIVKAHQGAVNSVARSPDGNRLATAGSDGKLLLWDARLWDTSEGVVPRLLFNRSQRVLAAPFSPKGSYLAWAGDEGVVHLWDLAADKEACAFLGHTDRIFSLAFSPDELLLASAGADGTVRLWDTLGAAPPRILRGHTNEVNCVAFTSDGSRLASGADDGTVRIWDVAGGAEVCVLKHHQGFVDSLAFSPDGKRLASCGADGTIRIADARPWTPESRLEQEARGLVEGLYARPKRRADVLAEIEGHRGITDAVRRQALDLAERFQDDPERFRHASRDVVRYKGATPALYQRALGWAQTANDLGPENGPGLTTLAMAQYRLGQFAQALATLARAAPLNQADPRDQPAELAFTAMAQHSLAKQPEAMAALARLRQLMNRTRFKIDEEARTFLAEAETVLAK